MNTFGKTHDELVEENTKLLEEGFSKHPVQPEQDYLRGAMLNLSIKLKETALNHKVLPKQIDEPVKDGEGKIISWIRVEFGINPEEYENAENDGS